MKLNKLFPIALVALMGGLTACNNGGGGGGGGDGSKITVWATAAEQAVVNKVLVNYNAQAADADKISEIDYVAISEADAGTTVAKDPSAETAPDLFLVADDHIYNLQSKNIVLDVTAYGADIAAKNSANAVAGAMYNNKYYGFPVTDDNGYFLWYNGTMITNDEAGSLDKILQKAASTGKTVLFDIANGYYSASVFLSGQVAGTNSLKFRENTNGDVIYDIGWDTDAAASAFDAMRTLYATYSSTFVAADNSNVVEKMKTGEACAAIFGNHVYNSLYEALGANLKATKLPTFRVGTTECQMGSFVGSKVYCVNATKTGGDSSVRRQKAVKFANYLIQKESQLVRFEERGTVPCNKEALLDTRYTTKKNVSILALEAQSQFAAVQSTSAEGRYWDVGKAIGTAIKDNNIGSYTTSKQFLAYQCGLLRVPAV